VDFISAFRPVAARLVAECGQTIQLGVLDDREVVYVAKVDGTEPVRLVSHDGARLPAHTTALGKALLASLPPDDFERLYRRRTLTPRTRYSIVSLETLRAEVDAIRGQGFACDHEETALGLYCVAACVMGRDGKAVAAVSISIPGHRMREDRFAEMADRVRRTASAISASLGYAGVRTQSANGS
jgi:IclR family acetate operon transcriptional repressor